MSTTTDPPLKSKYRVPDVQEVIAGLPEIPRDVVTHAAFGSLDHRLWDILTDDLWIEEFADAAKLMVTDLHNQIEEARAAERDGLSVPDPDWYRRVIKVKGRCDTLHAHLSRRVKELRRRREGKTLEAVLKAITLHRQTVLAEYEPTAADEELWKVLT